MEMFRQPQPQPDLNHAVLKALLASWLLSSSMTTLYTMLVCRKDWVPRDSSQSPALQLQAVDVPTQLDGEL